jgi:hypothetical protein
MVCTTMQAAQVVLGAGQVLVGVVAIGLVLRGRRGSPDQHDFRGGLAWAVAGWAVFGLPGLVWVVRALQR